MQGSGASKQDGSVGHQVVSAPWLQNQTGNLSDLFAEAAEEHQRAVQQPISIPQRPRALDFFDSDEEEEEEEEEEDITSIKRKEREQKAKPLAITGPASPIPDEELIWVEKTPTSHNITGKRKRKDKEASKPRKKKKREEEASHASRKSAKRKLKEKEKIMKLEEKIRKEYGGMKRPASYQWGTVIKDASGDFMSVKENPLRSDNEFCYWDGKADRELLLYERLYANHIPKYFHSPKRFLGLKHNESVRYIKQHQMYLVTENNQASSKEITRYFIRPLKRTNATPIRAIPQPPIEFNRLNFLPIEVEGAIPTPEENPEESFEEYIMRKTGEFNRHAHNYPKDIQNWLHFIEFQNEIQSNGRMSCSKKAITEKKMSIYLCALQKNEDSEILLLGYLQCCKEIWEMDKLISLWEKVMVAKRHSVAMWEHYLTFRMTHFASFSVSACRKIFLRALAAMFHLQMESSQSGNLQVAIQAEESQLEFFRRLCLFEAQSGYMERAVALYQAMIEFNNGKHPPHLEEYRSRIRVFEAFWDSEVPRIGEDGAVGWNVWVTNLENGPQEAQSTNLSPKTTYETQVNQLLEKMKSHGEEMSFRNLLLEENLRHCFWKPKRAVDLEDTEDMEQVILFSDIEEYILPIHMELFKVKLISNFVDFLLACFGGENKVLLHGSQEWSTTIPNIIRESESVGPDLCQFLPQHTDLVANMLAPPTDVEADYHAMLPKENSLFNCENHGNDSLLSDDMAHFIGNLFTSALSLFPANAELSNFYLRFELYYHRTPSRNSPKQRGSAMKQLCRGLLRTRSTDLTLWHQYAQAEKELHHFEEAKKIYDTALSMSALCNESLLLISSYALLELTHPTFKTPTITSSKVLSIIMGSTETQFQSIQVKRKEVKILSTLFQTSSGIDFASLSPNVFPIISPIRILQCQSKLSEIFGVLAGKVSIPQSHYVDQMILYALFEYVRKGLSEAMKVIENIAALKWKDSLFSRRIYEFELSLLEYHTSLEIVPPVVFRQTISRALQKFPNSPLFLQAFIQHESRSQLQNRVRRYFDRFCNNDSSPIIWLFAIKFETKRPGTLNRIISLFERALEIPSLSHCSLLWRSYIHFHIHRNEMESAKRIYFRAIRSIPSSKALWILCTSLGLSNEETADLLQLMTEKEVRLRITL